MLLTEPSKKGINYHNALWSYTRSGDGTPRNRMASMKVNPTPLYDLDSFIHINALNTDGTKSKDMATR